MKLRMLALIKLLILMNSIGCDQQPTTVKEQLSVVDIKVKDRLFGVITEASEYSEYSEQYGVDDEVRSAVSL